MGGAASRPHHTRIPSPTTYIGKLLANPQKLTAAVVGRGIGRAGLSYAVENAVEAGQDIATPAIIEALKLDFPGFDWEKEKKDFWKGRSDVAVGMLPLTLLGLGAASVKVMNPRANQ